MSYNDSMKVSPLIKYLCFELYTASLLAPLIYKKNDPDILHRFRVALRQSRSLIILYMPEQYAFSDTLKSILQQSNQLRELDVFLQEEELLGYPNLHYEIKQYRKTVLKKQATQKNIKHICSALNLMYEELLASKMELDRQHLVAKAQASYTLNIKHYRAINKKTTQDQLHHIRIGFKVTRYALEFLTQTGMKNEGKKIQKCKEKQDHLGKVQDIANQILWAKHFCKQHQLKECKMLIKSFKQRLQYLKKSARAL